MMPDCIIFDEATAMLDPEGRREIAKTMRELNREKGITVITITHYMNEAVEADRVVVLNEGELFLDGTPTEVFAKGEELRSVGLATPQITELFDLLRDDGYELRDGVLHTMEAADEIEAYLKKRLLKRKQ